MHANWCKAIGTWEGACNCYNAARVPPATLHALKECLEFFEDNEDGAPDATPLELDCNRLAGVCRKALGR